MSGKRAASSDVAVEFVRDVVGYPDTGSVVTVERTEQVERLFDLGFAVEYTGDEPAPPIDDVDPPAS